LLDLTPKRQAQRRALQKLSSPNDAVEFQSLSAARAKGVKFGRPSTLWRHKDKVCALLKQGVSCRAVARETGLPLGSVFNISRGMVKQTVSATPLETAQ
jgi:hypothetical protein